MKHEDLHIIIVGAGIGGLTAAIACRRSNPRLKVTVLERSPEILTIGAGIHIPPNACKILTQFGLLDKLKAAGGYEVDEFALRRYANGEILAAKPLMGSMECRYGAQWIAIHRGDYQKVLLDAAVDLGAGVITYAEAINVETGCGKKSTVFLNDGRKLEADVVIGADGLWSQTRDIVLGHRVQPQETGDLAYRATFSRKQLLDLNDSAVTELLEQSSLHVWLGPGKHAVFYPLRDHTEYNLVLLVADDLPTGVRTAPGTMEEMVANFNGWDPTLKTILSSATSAPLKWKLLHFRELQQWTKSTVALLGDACHPSLPYLGQGAAMAVEDGATLGMLFAAHCEREDPVGQRQRNREIGKILRQYERLRKNRAEIIVAGAVHTREYYHFPDGDRQKTRDRELVQLSEKDWNCPCSFKWGDAAYQRDLLSFDIAVHAKQQSAQDNEQRTSDHLDQSNTLSWFFSNCWSKVQKSTMQTT